MDHTIPDDDLPAAQPGSGSYAAPSAPRPPFDAAQQQAILRRAATLLDELPALLRRRRDALPEDVLWRMGDALRAVKRWRECPPHSDAEFGRLLALADELDRLVSLHVPQHQGSLFGELSVSLVLAVGIALLVRAFLFEAFQIPTGSMIPTLRVGDRIFVSKFVYGLDLPFGWGRVLDWRQPARGEVIVFRFPWGGVHDGKHFIKRVIAVAGDEVALKNNAVLVNGASLAAGEELGTPGPCFVEPGDACTSRSPSDSLAQALASGRAADGCECVLQPERAGAIRWRSQHVSPGSLCECQRTQAEGGTDGFSCTRSRRRILESPRTVQNDASWPPRFRSKRLLDGWRGAAPRGPLVVPPGYVFVMGDNRDFSEDGRFWGLVPLDHVEGKAWFVWYSEEDLWNRLFRTVH